MVDEGEVNSEWKGEALRQAYLNVLPSDRLILAEKGIVLARPAQRR